MVDTRWTVVYTRWTVVDTRWTQTMSSSAAGIRSAWSGHLGRADSTARPPPPLQGSYLAAIPVQIPATASKDHDAST